MGNVVGHLVPKGEARAEDMHARLSPAANALINAAFAGLDVSKVIDTHSHICGLGRDDTGCYVNEKMTKRVHVFHHQKLHAFLAGAGVDLKDPHADRTYVLNLLHRLHNCRPAEGKEHGRMLLLAFDEYYDKDGQCDKSLSGFHVPNDYIWQLAQEFPDSFIPSCSIHPYRKDAVQELAKAHGRGIRVVKWLPNAQGMDPNDELCVPFYKKMVEYDMVLLTHTGDERSVDAGYADNDLGDPFKLRMPLDLGVKVIAAHCATEGNCCDVDEKSSSSGKAIPCFDAFLRLMEDPKYVNNFAADISATPAFLRAKFLDRLLDNTAIHHRLLNGSDYPVPTIGVVVWTSRIRALGHITRTEEKLLNEIFKLNPLLFDFVMKRTMRSKKGNKFAAAVFETARHPFFQFADRSTPSAVVSTSHSSSSASSSAGSTGDTTLQNEVSRFTQAVQRANDEDEEPVSGKRKRQEAKTDLSKRARSDSKQDV